MNDLIILGGGPAGYLAAERAASAGVGVVLIEKDALGGVCLNEGCIPSKTLLYSAKIYENAKHGEAYGVHASDISINHPEVIARKNKVVKVLTSGVAASLKSHGVRVVSGVGHIEGRDAGGDFKVSAGEKHFYRNVCLSRPVPSR